MAEETPAVYDEESPWIETAILAETVVGADGIEHHGESTRIQHGGAAAESAQGRLNTYMPALLARYHCSHRPSVSMVEGRTVVGEQTYLKNEPRTLTRLTYNRLSITLYPNMLLF